MSMSAVYFLTQLGSGFSAYWMFSFDLKGGWGLVRFSKNGYNGGWEIVARNGGGGNIKESMGSCSIEKYFLCSGFEISCEEFLWM